MSDANWEELKAQLAAERKRREEADTRLHAALEQIRQTFAARGARTPGGGFAGILAGVEDLADRAERAEADNAALTERLQAVCDAAMKTDWMGKDGEREARFPWDEVEFALRDLHTKHPGAAMLERMRALEALAAVVRTYLDPGPSREHDLFPVRNALAALEALKVPHE